MRPQQVARAAWRAASSSGSRNRLLASSEACLPTPTVRSSFASASASTVLPRSFGTSSSALKKKQKKVVVADEFDEEFDDAEDDDGMISGDDGASLDDPIVAEEPGSSSAEASAEKAVRKPSVYSQTGVREVFANKAGDWRDLLEWKLLDIGKKPPLTSWRHLAGAAKSQREFDVVLELARLYRDRVGSLGSESGERLASRAASVNRPEIALNALMDRYINGLEYTLESLYLILKSMSEKLSRGQPHALLRSATQPGAPAHRVDLFGPVSSAPADAKAETPEGGENAEAAKAEPTKQEQALQLARAKMTLIDRMSMTASLTPPLTATRSHDPVLLAFIPAALINAFSLKKPASPDSPSLDGVKARTNELIALLISVIDQSLADKVPSAFVLKGALFSKNRAELLRYQLAGTLRYVALQDKSVEFRHPVSGTVLDPVHSVYRYMDHVAPDQVEALVRTVEPSVQAQSSQEEEQQK